MKKSPTLLVAGLIMLLPIAASAQQQTQQYLEDPPVTGWVAPRAAFLSAVPASLHETGRIGVAPLPAFSFQIAPVVADRDERALPSTANPDASGTATEEDPMLDYQYGRAAGAIEQCRIEVARRQQVRPADLRAGTMLLRWTVQPTGDVRNSEVISVVATDLKIAACAKRVIASWSFVARREGQVTVQRTFTFRSFRRL